MISSEQIERIKTLAGEVSEREGCRLYDVEFTGSGKFRVLRIFIESEAATVSIEQCANVSRGVSLLLDVEDAVPGGEYQLEVSSPGLDRVLREPWHFKKAIGQPVKVITYDRVPELKGEVKSLQAPILSADETHVEFQLADANVRVPYENIKRAQVVFEVKKNEKKR